MKEQPFASLGECFGNMPDPRVEGRCDHVLVEILRIAVCAVMGGAESWSEVEEFGNAKEALLKQYLTLAAGNPSHDNPLALECMVYYEGWAGLRCVVMVQRERRLAAVSQTETVYYLSQSAC